MKSYENKFIIGVDHGYGNIKTANHCFKTGITAYDTEPLFTKDMLIYDGKYYLIGEGHKEFLRDKVQDNDYYCLTLVAIAMELSDVNIYEADVIIAAGLPLAWTSGQKEAFAKYLSQNEDVTFTFRDVDYNIHISDVKIFPQGYSAILPYTPRMKGLIVMADIGNGTMNMMFLENGRPKAESKMYTEKFGVYQCTLAVRAAFSKLTQREIDDFIIDTVLREGTADISKSDLQIITATAQEYVEGIFRRLREHGYLHYCYLLGKLPKYHQRQPLSPEMREAWRHLDRLSNQVRLISKRELHSLDDVSGFINETDTSIKEVADARQKIYNKLRRCDDDERRTELLSRRDDCTTLLKQLRKEKRIAQTIIEDNPTIKENIRIETQAINKAYGLDTKQKYHTRSYER